MVTEIITVVAFGGRRLTGKKAEGTSWHAGNALCWIGSYPGVHSDKIYQTTHLKAVHFVIVKLTQFKTEFYQVLELSSPNSCIFTGAGLTQRGRKATSQKVKKNLSLLYIKHVKTHTGHTQVHIIPVVSEFHGEGRLGKKWLKRLFRGKIIKNSLRTPVLTRRYASFQNPLQTAI